jgi:hypothetical protein
MSGFPLVLKVRNCARGIEIWPLSTMSAERFLLKNKIPSLRIEALSSTIASPSGKFEPSTRRPSVARWTRRFRHHLADREEMNAVV